MSFINVSEKAAAQIKLIQANESKLDSYLRVSVTGGGCSGLSYKLNFEPVPDAKDKLVETLGVRLLVDQKSALFIKGMILDYTDGLQGQGFLFQNPNAKQSCGCGSSFSA
jgi:iron-sulfur cluster assembly protein